MKFIKSVQRLYVVLMYSSTAGGAYLVVNFRPTP